MSDLLWGFIIYASLTLVTWLLVLANRRLNFWRQLGVSHCTARLFFGNLLGQDTMGKTFTELFKKFRHTREPFCGFFFFMEPTAFVLDKSLAWKILSTDKHNFIVEAPSLNTADIDNSNLLEANSQVLSKLTECLLQLGKPVNVNYFCNKYVSAVIALLFGAGVDNVESSSNEFLHNWRYILRICYSKGITRSNSKKLELFKSLAVCRDVTASMLSCMLLQLANKQDSQQKLRSELLKLYESDGTLSNKAFTETEFVDKEIGALFNEYAPYSHIILRTHKNYPTNLSGYTLKPNRLVIIPIEAFAKFGQELDLKALNMVTIEMLLVKAALVFILSKYKFDICNETPVNMKFQEILPHKILKTKIYLKVQKL